MGRFHSIDVLTELVPDINPYQFAFNNPNYWSDPTGLFPGGRGQNIDDVHTDNDGTWIWNGNDWIGQDGAMSFYNMLDAPEVINNYGNNDGGGSTSFGDGPSSGSFFGPGFGPVISSGNYNTPVASPTPAGLVSLESTRPKGSLIDQINWFTDIGATGVENISGSFRLTSGVYNGNVWSPKYYFSGWIGGSRAGIKTFNIGKIGKGLGQIGFAFGTINDGYGVFQYYNNPTSSNSVHPGKAGLNLGMVIYGLYVNPITGALYAGLDAFYPGGTLGAMSDYTDAQTIYRETTEQYLRQDYNGILLFIL